MIRHTRQGKIVLRDEPSFDETLNRAIEDIERTLPTAWDTVLNYIDSEAVLLNTNGLSDSQLIRMTEKKQGIAGIYYRLARLFSK